MLGAAVINVVADICSRSWEARPGGQKEWSGGEERGEFEGGKGEVWMYLDSFETEFLKRGGLQTFLFLFPYKYRVFL